jgi:uncharacterized low-complexity protein
LDTCMPIVPSAGSKSSLPGRCGQFYCQECYRGGEEKCGELVCGPHRQQAPVVAEWHGRDQERWDEKSVWPTKYAQE